MKKVNLRILYDSNHMTFWKRKKFGESKNFSDCQESGERVIHKAQGIFRPIQIFYMGLEW